MSLLETYNQQKKVCLSRELLIPIDNETKLDDVKNKNRKDSNIVLFSGNISTESH